MDRVFRPQRLVRHLGVGFLIVMLAASGFGPGRFAFAGFSEGLAAYDGGDLSGAYQEWLPLAEAGNLEAQVALAGLLESGGPGFERNLVAAADWYRRAALQGDPIAQMNLGELYAEGRGVEREPLHGLAWLSLAAEQGRGWAAQRRDALAASLNAEQRAAAAKLADKLRARH